MNQNKWWWGGDESNIHVLKARKQSCERNPKWSKNEQKKKKSFSQQRALKSALLNYIFFMIK